MGSGTTVTTITTDMGQQREYLESGGFSAWLYTQKGSEIVASNGVVGKVVEKIDGTSFDGLPIFSNTSEVYFKRNKDGHIVQARIYKDRKPVCDFDWDHPHTNKSGEKFPEGVVHVQEFVKQPDGTWKRLYRNARYMRPEEKERYGELIKLANPNAKLEK